MVIVIVVAVLPVIVAATPPIVTDVAPLRFVPVMVVVCPPARGPVLGAILVIVGAARYV